jgi:hypothetical protein
MMVGARLLWLATGCAWASRSLLEFLSPDYWDPVTALDWAAVRTYIEDGLGVEVGGVAYGLGFVLAWLGLAVLAVMFRIDGRARLATLAGALVVGIALFTVGGGLIVLAALASLAVAPSWFEAVAAVAQPASGDRADAI